MDPGSPTMDASGGISDDNWAEFVKSVDRLNEFVRPNVLRRYQAEILDSGKFSVVSPLSGERLEVTRSTLVGQCLAYLIPDSTNIWLIASALGKGFPIDRVLIEAEGSARTLSDVRTKWKKRFRSAYIAKLVKAGARYRNSKRKKSRRYPKVTLIIGATNFAHHLWNELSALNEWLDNAHQKRLTRLTILATAEPLGPLQKIFPRLADTEVQPVTQKTLKKSISHARIAVRVGSRFVTEKVRHNLLKFSRKSVDRPTISGAMRLLKSGWPRIWVSVRTGTRTADNYNAFLLSLFRKIFDEYPDAAILIDGFTYPFGFFDDPRTVGLRDSFSGYVKFAEAFFDELRAEAEAQLGSAFASRLYNISGLTIPEAIVLGAACDYYICHAGTLQHKVGWVQNIPGFIHSKEHRARWHAAQVEDGVRPGAFPNGFVGPSKGSASRRPGRWNANYRFVDADKSAEFVFNAMRSQIGDERLPVARIAGRLGSQV